MYRFGGGSLVQGLVFGGEGAGVAPGLRFEAEVEDAIEFVERDAHVEAGFGGDEAGAAGGLHDGQAFEIEPAGGGNGKLSIADGKGGAEADGDEDEEVSSEELRVQSVSAGGGGEGASERGASEGGALKPESVAGGGEFGSEISDLKGEPKAGGGAVLGGGVVAEGAGMGLVMAMALGRGRFQKKSSRRAMSGSEPSLEPSRCCLVLLDWRAA